MDKIRSQTSSWIHQLSQVNPNILDVLLAIVLISTVLYIESLGKNPPAVAAPASDGKIVFVDSKGNVRTKEVENKKEI